MHTTPRIVLSLVVLSSGFCAAEESSRAHPLHLVVDYLPVAVYAGDDIALNVRVENAGTAPGVAELVFERKLRGGESAAAESKKLEPVGGGFSSASFLARSSDVTAFTLKLRSGGTTLAALEVEVLHDDEAWPKTRVRAGVLETEAGARWVWAPARREKKLDRAFLPMKWLLGDAGKKSAEVRAAPVVLALLPAGYASAAQGLETGALSGVAPILLAARAILEAGTGQRALVLGLPPEDVEAATDPRVYRVVLDGLMTRLRAGGTQELALLPPFRYGFSEARMKVLWKEVAEACETYNVRYVDVADLLQETYWRADPSRAGAYAQKPNAAGRGKIDEILRGLGVGYTK